MSAVNTYHGRPCRYGHGTLRYSNGNCVACTVKRSLGDEGQAYRKSWKGRYVSYKTKAKQRGWPFELSQDQFKELILAPCAYCNEPATGIDRVDTNKGYTTDNCAPACGFCNIAKNDKTVDEFFRKIRLIYEHRIIG